MPKYPDSQERKDPFTLPQAPGCLPICWEKGGAPFPGGSWRSKLEQSSQGGLSILARHFASRGKAAGWSRARRWAGVRVQAWQSRAGSSGRDVSKASRAAPPCPPAAPLPGPSLTGSEAPGPPPGPGRAGEGNVIPAQLTRLWRPAPGRVAAGACLRLRGPPGRGPIRGRDTEVTHSRLLGPRPEVTRSPSLFILPPLSWLARSGRVFWGLGGVKCL